MPANPQAQIERINQVSAMARTSWIALLGYLAFIGVSLLAVEDADFFVPTRRTELPLVGVAIPTHAFFLFAPILAAALYVYLHLHLLKLWDAIADAPATINNRPLGEHLHPWIANDYALALKGSGALRRRPMRWLGNLATRLLVWIAGPLVIAGFWWRSMPAHDEWLTLTIAAALLVSLYAALTSWWTLRTRMRFSSRPAHPWQIHFRRPVVMAFALLVVVTSWLRTEGGLDYYANRLVDLADAAFGSALFKDCAVYGADGEPIPDRPADDCLFANGDRRDSVDVQRDRIAALPWLPTLDTFTLTHDNWLAGLWLDEGETWNPLARTDLEGVELVDLPEDWRTPETARLAFRKTWCEREGLSMAVCDHPPSPDRPAPATRAAARKAWCWSDGIDTAACLSQFDALDARFEIAWTEERAATLATLPHLVLAGRDLRNAAAARTSLVGADLTGARLEGADLWQARLEGADLGGARLEGAVLDGARLERAVLDGAWLEGADLGEVRLEGADLGHARLDRTFMMGARLEGANLWAARLEGTALGDARLEGANLRGARLERVRLNRARLRGVTLGGARLWAVDLGSADFRWTAWGGASTRATLAHYADFRGARGLTQEHLDQMIGNAQTLLPDTGSFTLPSCWKTPPPGFDALIKRVSETFRPPEVLRVEFLCPEGMEPQRTGTRLPVDAPYPEGHPLAPQAQGGQE